MAKINAINNKSEELTIDPGAAGDSFVQFDINTTGEFRIGVDDDASDAFKISQGSALGANDTFVMTAAGERTMPLQPAFSVYANTDILTVTGDGTTYTVVFNTEIFDQNGDATATTVTAPVTGKYYLGTIIDLGGIGAGHTDLYTETVTSNRTYSSNYCAPFGVSGGSYTTHSETIADMDAADTATFTVTVSGGAKTVAIDAAASPNLKTLYFGYLVC